ncbi:MAG: 23S rRNA (pseudouridine(1915)-N(3))-methyltransferase RlmH [Bacilli bacterium]|nr:23S rRNA (pseudouridine(1915)-N(3))-methyltransferase RlmH [Bacilli bacterium]
MKIKIIAVGSLKEKYLQAMVNEYTKRLSKYCHIDIVEVKEENDTHPHAKEIEGERILKLINPTDYVVALALKKKECTSEELAVWLEKTFVKAKSNIIFLIGGSLGLAPIVIKRANDCLTLSKLTFTHQMSRAILLEQIYRCFKILHHEQYHK